MESFKDETGEQVKPAYSDVLMVAIFASVGMGLAALGHMELAATVLGGALAYAVPHARRVTGTPIVLAMAIGSAAMLGGCGSTTLASVKPILTGIVDVSCRASRAVTRACDAAGIGESGAVEASQSGADE